MLPCQESNASDLKQSNQIDALSPAEKSVVNLLLEGLSNRCIAKRLVLSRRERWTSVIPMDLRIFSC